MYSKFNPVYGFIYQKTTPTNFDINIAKKSKSYQIEYHFKNDICTATTHKNS